MHAFEAKVGVEKYPIFIGNNIFKELNSFIKTYNKKSVFIISDSYFKNSNDPDSKDRFENVAELLTSIEEFSNRDPAATLSRFLEDVSLQTDIDHWNDSENRVTMMTVHAAKGLEFPYVFVVGLEQNLFPSLSQHFLIVG